MGSFSNILAIHFQQIKRA
jgi:hypothetical protein